jgi:hypothetical protein
VSPKFIRGGERPKPQPGTVSGARAYELHGTRYYQVIFQLDGEPGVSREARLSFDMTYDDPQPGDRVLVQQILGVVDKMSRADGESQSPATSDQATSP